jgi:hypothetical protein
MTTTTLLLLLIVAALVGVISTLLMLMRQRREQEAESGEHQFAVSSEGQKRCPSCSAYNAWTDSTCVSCGRRLPG